MHSDDLDKKFKEINDAIKEMKTFCLPQQFDFSPIDTPCLFEQFMKNLPEWQKTQVLMLSCPCRKCSPFCMSSPIAGTTTFTC